jgi:hypothetical protein
MLEEYFIARELEIGWLLVYCVGGLLPGVFLNFFWPRDMICGLHMTLLVQALGEAGGKTEV